MRGVTLGELVRRLRVQLSHSTNVAHGQATQESLEERIRMAQDWLWEVYDWEHLNVDRDIVLQDGQRYYPVPTDLTAERINRVAFKYASDWIPLEYGISPDCYSQYDSDADVRSWPVYRWRFAEDPDDSTGNIDAYGKIEVWPIPSQNGESDTKVGCLRVRGIRVMRPLTSQSSKSELDGNLIVLTAAVPLVARQNQKDAERMAAELEKLRLRLQGQSSIKSARHSFVDQDVPVSKTDLRFAYVRT